MSGNFQPRHFIFKRFNITALNGPFGDAGFYCDIQNSPLNVLIDCGDLKNLGRKQLLTTKLLLISHAHMDHVFGFDHFIRFFHSESKPLVICGPSGISKRVLSKINSYTWNLIEKDQINFTVFEIDGKSKKIEIFKIYNSDGVHIDSLAVSEFTDELFTELDFSHILDMNGLSIRVGELEHRTPSLSYHLTLAGEKKVDTNALEQLQLKNGKWIAQILNGYSERGEVIEVDGKLFDAKELEEKIIVPSPSYALSYATDFSFTAKNEFVLKALHKGTNALICESTFTEEDRRKAVLTHHLTTRQCALVAAMLGVPNLLNFHYSKSYSRPETIESELFSFLQRFRDQTVKDLRKEIEAEYTRCKALAASL